MYGGRGVFGLCSNVAEWTSTWAPLVFDLDRPRDPAKAVPNDRVARGGALEVVEGDPSVTPQVRNPRQTVVLPRATVAGGLGFRCVRSAKPRLDPADFAKTVARSAPKIEDQAPD